MGRGARNRDMEKVGTALLRLCIDHQLEISVRHQRSSGEWGNAEVPLIFWLSASRTGTRKIHSLFKYGDLQGWLRRSSRNKDMLNKNQAGGNSGNFGSFKN